MFQGSLRWERLWASPQFRGLCSTGHFKRSVTRTDVGEPSHFGSAARPGRRLGSGTGALSIGSGNVHGISDALHPGHSLPG